MKKLSQEQIYKRNQKRSKALRISAPLCFWVFLALSIVCVYFALRNSFGNVLEIIQLLDKEKYTGIELQTNYNMLIERYGEWVVGTGSTGFTISFINIGNALINGIMIANTVLAIVFYVSAYVLGKWLLPSISKQILIDNQDMVNLKILKGE